MNSQPLSRMFDAALQLIAEDLCSAKQCDVGLYDYRNELRGNGVIEALNRHVAAINPDFRVEPLDRDLCKGLVKTGIPFKLVNSKSGSESWMQLGGGDPGVFECERASEAEVAQHRAYMAENHRRCEVQARAKEQLSDFLNTLLTKVRAQAAGAVLTAEQKQDFDYFLRFTPEGKTITTDSGASIRSALEGISQACVVLGITLDQLIALQ